MIHPTRRLAVLAVAAVSVCSLVLASAYIAFHHLLAAQTISAMFTRTTSIYVGDAVKVAGVKVGTIISIEPQGATSKLTMHVDHNIPIPANAEAIIVAQNLISARYVQLTPPYDASGPLFPDGGVIPVDRTAVPVEWDEVKTQLNRLALALGPSAADPAGSLGRFIDSAANALGGNGEKFRETLNQLSKTARILADGGSNIADIISHLQVFVTAFRDSGQQIVQFEDRLATLSSVIDGSRSDLDAAVTDLSSAVGDVRAFLSDTRDKTTEQVQRLANVTQNLVDHRQDLEELLHTFPNVLGNFYNIYDPTSGTSAGSFVINNFSNPVQMLCSAMASASGGNAAEGAKKCAEYLGPLLRLVNPLTLANVNFNPIPINPFLSPTPPPDRIIYTDPSLMPGGAQEPSTPVTTLPELLLPTERPAP